MRNQSSHNFGTHTIGCVMCGSYKRALYTVLLSAVDGEILLPVCVRHVENARTGLVPYTLQRQIGT